MELLEEALEQFVFYQKDLKNKKSHKEKKVQKLQKMKQDLSNPEIKKQRYKMRRNQQKKKLQKQLSSMNEEEVRKYFDDKKEKKELTKKKILKALKDGQQIYIDMAYEKYMNQKQNKSLAIQIQLIMKAIKCIQHPPGIHLCSVAGVAQKQLTKMSYQHWTLESHAEDIIEVANLAHQKLIYLSPDAPEALETVQEDTAYVIGGLVDRTIIKNASLTRAQNLGIQARHLPIRKFMKSRTCLNLDHVVMILCKFKQCKNWKEAFDFGAPKRWKRDENEFGIRQIKENAQKSEQQNKRVQNDSSDFEQIEQGKKNEKPSTKQQPITNQIID